MTNDPCDDMPVHIARRWAGLRPCGHKLTADPGCKGCLDDVYSGRNAIDAAQRADYLGNEPVSYGRRVPRRPGCP